MNRSAWLLSCVLMAGLLFAGCGTSSQPLDGTGQSKTSSPGATKSKKSDAVVKSSDTAQRTDATKVEDSVKDQDAEQTANAVSAGAQSVQPNSPATAASKKGPSAAGVSDSPDEKTASSAEPAGSDTAASKEKGSPATASREPSTTTNATDAATSSASETGAERFIVLLPGGPLVVDLVATIDGQPLGKALDETLSRLLAEADTDKDGRATWDEITRQPAFQRGLYGNLPVGADNDRRQVIQRYDWNRDKIVSRDELLRWLVREPHRAKALVVDSLAGSRTAAVADSPLLRVLDADSDGTLSFAELADAPRRLAGRDTDEDEIIVPAELRMQTTMTAEPPTAQRNDPTSPAIVLLGTKTDWATFQRTMQDSYSLGGPLGPEAWPAAAELFRELDVNRDGWVGRSEWAILRAVEPHLVLDTRFGSPGDSLKLHRVAPELAKLLADKQPDNVQRFELPSGRLEITLSAVPLPDYAAQARATLMMFDGDKNNYLEESEAAMALAGVQAAFADIDANGDGKIYAEELETALRRRQSVAVDQVRVQAGYRDDAWWRAADANDDGRLDGVEIDALAERFRAFDRDGNQSLQRDEIPLTFQLQIVRGGQGEGVSMLPTGEVPPANTEKQPAWFVQMDSNADGRIGRREFLGSLELFEKLDRNKDGRLDWSELREFGERDAATPEAVREPASP